MKYLLIVLVFCSCVGKTQEEPTTWWPVYPSPKIDSGSSCVLYNWTAYYIENGWPQADTATLIKGVDTVCGIPSNWGASIHDFKEIEWCMLKEAYDYTIQLTEPPKIKTIAFPNRFDCFLDVKYPPKRCLVKTLNEGKWPQPNTCYYWPADSNNTIKNLSTKLKK